MPAASIVHDSGHTPHDFSGYLPLVKIGPLEIQTYFLIISLTFCLAILGLVWRARACAESRNTALDLAMTAMFGGFIGSRLMHVIFEAPQYYLQDPIQILHIERGGFVWYGGLLGGVASGLALAWHRHLAIAKWLDIFAPILAFGYGMGRIACFLTGCCFGDICQLQSGYSFRYPTQLFAVVWEGATLAGLLWFEKKVQGVSSRRSKKLHPVFKAGSVFWLWLLLHAVGRILMESFRADDRGPLIAGLSVSTLLSVIFGLFALGRLASQLMKPQLTPRRRPN